jgi:hypothetical protein
MKKLGVVITDGVGFRNFVMSDFLKEATSSFSKVIIYSGVPTRLFSINQYSNLVIKELDVYNESRLTWFTRRLKEIAHLFNHKDKTFGFKDTLRFNKPKGISKRSFLNRIVYGITSIFHSEDSIHVYEKWQFLSFNNNHVVKRYKMILEYDMPDLLFFTHQRPPFIAPMLSLAKQLRITTTAFIFSWDNLASKGRMLGEFDNYLVWSELMKSELLTFYSKTKSAQVSIVGTPQFEPYVLDRYEVNRDKFYQKFNLDYNKRLICYSCADSSIGKNDEVHIRAIWSFIKQQDKLQLIVRTSPAEDGSRFKNLMSEFPEIKWNIPKWKQTRKEHTEVWSQRLPSVEDILDLKSILMFSDVNVNMCSTMSLDFMIFDKPVINIAFGNKTNGLYDDQRFLNFTHYKYVIDSKAVSIATNKNELFLYLEEALTKPGKRKTYREELLKFEIGHPLKGTSLRIANALTKLC